MAKKGQTFNQYTEEFKLAAVQEYMKGSSSYRRVAEKLDIRNCTQLKVWVKNGLTERPLRYDQRRQLHLLQDVLARFSIR
ncbi:transposase, partial [Paenibacillus alginolyticus]|uniref:transposase n=1 Tax=Paenibacillus alginolyticus TaxID=59839 RepID=UPI0012B59E36